MPFAIRGFQPADFETLWRIDQDCFAPGIAYSREELKFYIRRRTAFTLVAFGADGLTMPDADLKKGQKVFSLDPSTGQGIAGFIVTEIENRGSGHIITIDVIAAARRSGVGSLLLRAAEGRLRAVGCHSVELETAVDNVSALSFYKRHGYTVIRTSPRYYSNGVDALVLTKELEAAQ